MNGVYVDHDGNGWGLADHRLRRAGASSASSSKGRPERANGAGPLATKNTVSVGSTRHSATFLPPPAVGEVFTVFEYKSAGQPAPTDVALAWGTWRRQGVIAPPPGGARGFIVRLRHVNPDSVALTFGTDGNIVSGPSQGAPPPEWAMPGYQQVLW